MSDRDRAAEEYASKHHEMHYSRPFYFAKSHFLAGWDARQAEVDRLREALRFYADKDNYRIYYHALSGSFDQDTKVGDDNGKMAREALGEEW